MKLPIWFQRAENGVLLVALVIAYAALGQTWWLFGLLLFVPDITMVGYALGPVYGAWFYNVGHSYIGPIILGLIGWQQRNNLILGIAAIWLAHIAMDRVLGYGLKLPTGFQHTHLGEIGKK
jgi:hypothetical protein